MLLVIQVGGAKVEQTTSFSYGPSGYEPLKWKIDVQGQEVFGLQDFELRDLYLALQAWFERQSR